MVGTQRGESLSVMKRRKSIPGIFLLVLSLLVPVLKAQDGLRGALSRESESAQWLAQLSSKIAAADFDDDHKPDGALLVEAGVLEGARAFRIELHLSGRQNTGIAFSSQESQLAISALDVNRDGTPDIVVEKAFTHERLQVYLNDGHGAFHQARAEDYPAPDPSSPNWGAELTQTGPAFCLPVSRNFETGILERVSILPRNGSSKFGLQPEVLLAQSAARAPAPARAPPSLLSF